MFRQAKAVVLAVDSPVGNVARGIDELTAHLPAPDTPWACLLCSAASWPYRRFDAAAHELMRAGLRLPDWVPYDLHPRLWPPPHRAPRPARSNPHHLQSSSWFTKEDHDG